MNIRNVVLILALVMVIAFALAAATSGGFFSWQNAINGADLENIDRTVEFDLATIQDIDINTISTDANIIPVEGSIVKVHLYGKVTEGILQDEFARLNGDRLAVDVKPKPGININSRINLTLDIYVPKEYVNRLTMDTVSGNMDASDLVLTSLEFSSVSGDMRTREVQANRLKTKTISGNIVADGFIGDVEANSVSGKIEIEYSEFTHDVSFNTTSGNTELTLPADAQFKVSLQTVSGKVNCAFPITAISTAGRNFEGVVVSDDHEIEVHSVSGGITIKEK